MILKHTSFQALSIKNKRWLTFNYIFLFIVATGITYFSQHIPFFWDNISLVSRLATYYYDTNFQSLILPNDIDPGHPPFYPLYVASMWAWLGKTLTISHWIVYPFLLGTYWLYYRLCCLILSPKLHFFALFLMLLEPTLLGQAFMGGIDIALVFATLLALNGIFGQQRWMACLGFILMASISLRSIIGIALFGMCELIWLFYLLKAKQNTALFENYRSQLFKKIIPTYLPAFFFITIWYYYHYQEAGFLMVNSTAAAWNEHYGYSSLSSFIWNLGIIGWRFLDHGRFAIWIVGLYFLWTIIRQRQTLQLKQKHLQLLLFSVVPIVLYSFIIAARNNPIMHRYLIVHYLLFSLLFVALMPHFFSKAKQNITIFFICFCLISGHFWVYPYPIANGWDANLSYLPYFNMQKKVLTYIDAQNIDYQDVAAEFPCAVRGRFSHLNEDERQFDSKQNRPFLSFPYILHSNLMNDFSLEELEQLQQQKHWKIERKWQSGQLYIILYKNITISMDENGQ